MKKIATAALAASLLSVSVAGHADVLDFTSSWVTPTISGAPEANNPNAVPILSRNPAPNTGGFIDEQFAYKGFTFQYLNSGGFSGNAWVWMTEPVAPAAGFQSYGYAYNSGTPGNGYILAGCTDVTCSAASVPTPEVSFAISSSTAFTFQSLKVARFAGDPFEVNLFSATGGPNRSITVTPDANNFTPILVTNPLYAAELFNKMTFTGIKGYYGVDDITLSPVPEASTYGMMLLGLAAVGAAARRRRS